MKRLTQRKVQVAALALSIALTACSANSSDTTNSILGEKYASRELNSSTKRACASVELSFNEVRKYEARYSNKASTTKEVVDAYKTAADAFTAAESLDPTNRVLFRAVALAFNQYRVGLETGSGMDTEAEEEGSSAVERYMATCNVNTDFEST